MKRVDCLFERVSHFGVGLAMLFMVMGFMIIGVTVLPVLGIFLALPVFLVAGAFFFAPRSQECAY